MSTEPFATLPTDDPLYALLAEQVFAGALGLPTPARIEVYSLDPSATVFRYADPASGVSVVGKFYGSKWLDGAQSGERERRAELLRREWQNLLRARALGFAAGPARVARPLAFSEAINCVLVVEHVPGDDLAEAISAAAYAGESGLLRDRLAALAGFLAELHRRASTDQPADVAQAQAYLGKLLGQLEGWQVIDPAQRAHFELLGARWAASGWLSGGRQALVHGDATPGHFIYPPGGGIVAIDLERMRYADPAADLGCVAAELRHLLSWYRGDSWAGEPFIRQFYASYATALGLGPAEFAALTERCRFYMGCAELRICRNSWVDLGYRRAFVAEAARCLAI